MNPFEDEQKKQEEEEAAAAKKKAEENEYREELGSWFSNPTPQAATGTGVGKYLREAQQSAAKRPKCGLSLNFP